MKTWTESLYEEAETCCYVISNPDCFKAPNSDTYVTSWHGEAKAEDMAASGHAQAGAFKAEAANGAGGGSGWWSATAGAAKVASITEEVDEGEEVDMEVLEEKDVDLVATQANVSKGKAAAALKASDGDIVSAIMELTM